MEKDNQFVRLLRLESNKSNKTDGNWTKWSCGSLFQCLFCLQPGQSAEDKKMDSIMMQLTELRRQVGQLIGQEKSAEDQLLSRDPGQYTIILTYHYSFHSGCINRLNTQ